MCIRLFDLQLVLIYGLDEDDMILRLQRCCEAINRFVRILKTAMAPQPTNPSKPIW